ncbi:MAG: PP2C family protein-serine/threonine phosphatase [Microcoleaceae cyanobacterium]
MQDDMPKQYLWAIGEGTGVLSPGSLVADRYLLRQEQVLLDTRPEQLPELSDQLPDEIVTYLRLFAYRYHIPVVYGLVPEDQTPQGKTIWLLERGAIDDQGRLMPKISEVWPQASAMRQLNWLWQLAQLWQPLSDEGVASSLLNPNLLRADGNLAQLLELQVDWQPATVAQLGQFWRSWIPDADARIQNFLQQLTQQMIAGEITTAEQLIHQLDQALVLYHQCFEQRIEIVTATETGPSRPHNEDACYPVGQNVFTVEKYAPGLVIVCDGIGGQDGGEVASQLAIDVLQQQIDQISPQLVQSDAETITEQLQQSVSLANDAICDRNDQESRQGRERMGTTMVMALAYGPEVYVSHVGDSRAYWVTRTGCYQVTLDDDVASREVRLGYALYRNALQTRSAGALIQALGITTSANLYPNVQRFFIDEDCVFLLCSDGLSDQEQVQQHWRTELLPILEGRVSLTTARDRLIKIANTQNGHDNVTVALLHFHITAKSDPLPFTEISVPPVIPMLEEPGDEDTLEPIDTDDIDPPTKLVDSSKESSNWTGLIAFCGALLLLALGALFLWRFLNNRQTNPSFGASSTINPNQSTQQPDSLTALKSVIQLGDIEGQPIELLREFSQLDVKGVVPAGSIFQILEKQSTPQSGTWLELRVCMIPEPESAQSEKPNGDLNGDDSVEADAETGDPQSDNELQESEQQEDQPEGIGLDSDLESEIAGEEDTSPTIATLQPGDIGWIRLQDIQELKRKPELNSDLLQLCEGSQPEIENPQ